MLNDVYLEMGELLEAPLGEQNRQKASGQDLSHAMKT